MGIEPAHSANMWTSLFLGAHVLSRMSSQYLPSFLSGNVAETVAPVFEEMPTVDETLTDQASSFEQMDPTGRASFVGSAQTVATVATMAWNYAPYIGVAVATAYLGYKAYRSLSRPMVEVVNNNNITFNVYNESPEKVEIQPLLERIKTEKGEEIKIDLRVSTPLTKTVKNAAAAA